MIECPENKDHSGLVCFGGFLKKESKKEVAVNKLSTETCIWSRNDKLDLWESGCNIEPPFCGDDSSPIDNNLIFCPFCGVKLKVINDE